MAVIDASVYIALINAKEVEHTSSWAWFEQATKEQQTIAAPVILLAEVAAALSHGVGDLSLAHRVVRQLNRSRVIELVPVTNALAEQAAVIAGAYRIRGCDAIYIALASQLEDCLITLDQQQLERAAAIVDICKP